MSDGEQKSSDIQESASSQSVFLLHDLIDRAQILLSDLKAFQSCLSGIGLSRQVELGYFRKSLESEAKSLDTISRHHTFRSNEEPDEGAEMTGPSTLHALKSSNLPFYEALWQTAKSCREIIALSKRIALTSGTPRPRRRGRGHHRADKHGVIDIVAGNGLEWVKISTVNEKRLLFDIAKEGWAAYGDDSEVDSEAETESMNMTSLSHELEIVQTAHHLCTAARNHRVRHQHPRVRFVFPKIWEGCNSQIDAVMSNIRAAGATVQCLTVSERDHITSSLKDLHVARQTDYTSMMPSPSTKALTSTVNIDCTVLLALISDISHIPRDSIPPYPKNKSGTYHTAILKQIQVEQEHPFVPEELYPILQGRTLVCTNHAADRMHQIVRTMGTPDEQLRSYIFFALDKFCKSSPAQLLDALRAASCHPVPDDLQLPIQVVAFDNLSSLPSSPATSSTTNANSSDGPTSDPISPSSLLPQPQISPRDLTIAQRIASAAEKLTPNGTTVHPEPIADPNHQSKQSPLLSAINASVFLYGWSHALTTVTSNKVVVSQLRKRIDDILDSDERSGGVVTKGNGGAVDDGEEDEFVGPNIYVCNTARSLVGKEKQSGPHVVTDPGGDGD